GGVHERDTLGEDAPAGAEAIMGLLVRHIAEAVDIARALEIQQQRARRATGRGGNGAVLTLTEAQIVQCARDVLILCNRTQSGGDTYFCIDSLMSARCASNPQVQ
ncbi:hypothetical protein B484DRAFT_395611, partial [Ochromonadaceae sp. CCMP2298]